MITLYQFPEGFGLPVSVSPYCAKVALYCRLTGHAFETAVGDVRKSPNKKVPYVRWPNGEIQVESDAIIARFEVEGPTLDDGLSDADRAQGREIEDLAELDLYFSCLYARFAEPDGWTHQKPTVKALVPWVLSPILLPIIRRSQVKLCLEAGYGGPDDYERAVAACATIADAIGDKRFLLGDEPRTADCGVWANLLQTAFTAIDYPVRAATRDSPVLMGYIERLADRADFALPGLD